MASPGPRRRRLRVWIGGAIAAVVVLGLIGQCSRQDDTEATAQPLSAPVTISPRTAPLTSSSLAATARATTPAPTPAPTTTAAAVRTTTAEPEPNPEPAPRPAPAPAPAPADNDDDEAVSYKNCAAVRAAGAAPIRRGDPGYASHLDRDGDGVGCES